MAAKKHDENVIDFNINNCIDFTNCGVFVNDRFRYCNSVIACDARECARGTEW